MAYKNLQECIDEADESFPATIIGISNNPTYSDDNNIYSLNVSNIPEGLYLINIQNTNLNTTEKLIICRTN